MATPKTPAAQEPPRADQQALAQMIGRAQSQQLPWSEVKKKLLRAEKSYPRSAFVQTLLGNLYSATQRPDKALQHLKKAADRATNKLSPYCNLARLCLLQDQLPEAQRWLERARSLSADHPAVLSLEGSLAVKHQEWSAAKAAFEKALIARPQDVEIMGDLANVELEMGFADAAMKRYQAALKLAPDALRLWFNYACALQDLRQMDRALEANQRCLKLAPSHTGALNNLGTLYLALGRPKQAKQMLEQAIELAPNDPHFRANLLDVFERLNQTDALDEALSALPSDMRRASPDLALFAAQSQARNGDKAGALTALEAIDVGSLSASRRGSYHKSLAQAHQSAGAFEQALAHYQAMNDIQAATLPTLGIEPSAFLAEIQANQRALTQAPARGYSTCQEPLAPSGAQLVFLVGFPRSGTTLLDTMLRSHSAIQVVEEGPMLMTVKHALAKTGQSANSPELSPEQLAALRAQYMKSLDAALRASSQPGLTAAAQPGGTTLVDKMPLNLVDALLIHRLFPAAKFVFSLRHPCDACLSCFMQNFVLNESMANFLTLADTVRAYDASMRLWQAARTHLPLAVFDLRYEDLVADMQGRCEALLSFLGLEWQDALLDYRKTAQQREMIRTPSFNQVVQPLYKTAQGRWRSYEFAFAPLMAQLQPWIEAYGYGED